MTDKFLSNLLYSTKSNELSPLPQWAYFYLDIGHKIASDVSGDTRTVIPLAIPTRHFAASLISVGIALARSELESKASVAQIEFLRQQPIGTSVHIRTTKGRFKGNIVGFTDFNGAEMIKIRQTGNTVKWYKLSANATRITLASTDVSIPKHHQTGREVEKPSAFVETILDSIDAKDYVLNTNLGCLIIGQRSKLLNEVCEQTFWVESQLRKASTIEGSLQDIIRVKEFLGANKAFRTQCLSISTAEPDKYLGNRQPPVIIFDGAIAYIKHHFRWSNSHHVVLLDRTERQFHDASEVINQKYFSRLDDDISFELSVPSNIEAMPYRDRRYE